MKDRIYAFDALKLLFSLVIALFHLQWHWAPQGYLGVELFFVISGFCLFYNKDKYIQSSALPLFLSRLKSYYIYYILFLFLSFCFFISSVNFSDILNAILFLQFLGIGNKSVSNVLWFLGVYTYVYAFYMFLLRKYSVNLLNFLPFALIVCMIKMYSISPNHSIMWTYETEYYVFNLPFCVFRGVVAMGTGLCFAYIANKYPARIKFSYLYSLLLIALIFHIFFNGVGAKYDYLISLIGGTLCYLLYCQNTYKSEKLKNNYINNYIKIISKYSLPIYVFHDIVISTLKKLNYSTENYPPQLYLLWVVLLAITMERLQKVLTLIYYRMKINLRG